MDRISHRKKGTDCLTRIGTNLHEWGVRRPGSIPKGLRPPAQGCLPSVGFAEEGEATLGNASTPKISTPTGVASSCVWIRPARAAPQPRWG